MQSNTTNDATSSNTSSSTNPSKSSSNSNQGLVDPLDLELEKLFENPTKGSTAALIQKFHDEDRSSPWDVEESYELVANSISEEDNLKLNKEQSIYATFIAVCKGKRAKFILYENGKNIAEGPCAYPNLVSYGPRREEYILDATYSYEIIGTDSYEVTLYQRKEKP